MNLLFPANKATKIDMLICLGGHVSIFIKKKGEGGTEREKKRNVPLPVLISIITKIKPL